MKTFDRNTLRIYTTLYHAYQLLYCKGHIQIDHKQSQYNKHGKKNNRVKMKRLV